MRLLAIDPDDCGCTECLTGEYVPTGQANDAQIQQLMLGEIRDNSYEVWTISQNHDGGFDISAAGSHWTVEEVAWPPEVGMYQIEFSTMVVNQIVSGCSVLRNNGHYC